MADAPADAHEGYLSARYAASFTEFGTPHHLPRADGWILKRSIPGSPRQDAMGCYPLFVCADWSALFEDLEELTSDLVSLVLVTDPFANVSGESMSELFDRASHFKDHFVTEFDRPLEEIVKKSHRSTVRRAQKRVEVSVCPNPSAHLDEWMDLWGNLVERHGIRGMRAFSRHAFSEQLLIPGMVMFKATVDGEVVGLDLWYVQGDVAYGHLVAFNDLGYKCRASYATKWYLLQYFQDKVRWVDFGAGAGAKDKSDGLTVYKQGWTNQTRPVFLCGSVFQPEPYNELVEARKVRDSKYFPAYRDGELA